MTNLPPIVIGCLETALHTTIFALCALLTGSPTPTQTHTEIDKASRLLAMARHHLSAHERSINQPNPPRPNRSARRHTTRARGLPPPRTPPPL
jgi:hypothetical protein